MRGKKREGKREREGERERKGRRDRKREGERESTNQIKKELTALQCISDTKYCHKSNTSQHLTLQLTSTGCFGFSTALTTGTKVTLKLKLTQTLIFVITTVTCTYTVGKYMIVHVYTFVYIHVYVSECTYNVCTFVTQIYRIYFDRTNAYKIIKILMFV